MGTKGVEREQRKGFVRVESLRERGEGHVGEEIVFGNQEKQISEVFLVWTRWSDIDSGTHTGVGEPDYLSHVERWFFLGLEDDVISKYYQRGGTVPET